MVEYITVEKQTENALYLHLNQPEMLESSLFTKMENDDYSLSCMVLDELKGQLMYSTKNLIRLSDFLRAYVFEKEEGYLFLHDLFQKAIAVNRSKPVVLASDFIYVSPFGDEIYFTVLPLKLEYWMFQKEDTLAFLEEILFLFQTTSAFELVGYLSLFLKSKEFSLPNLICGIKELESRYYPKRFWQKKPQIFRAAESVTVKSYFQNMEFDYEPDDPAQSLNLSADREGLTGNLEEAKTEQPDLGGWIDAESIFQSSQTDIERSDKQNLSKNRTVYYDPAPKVMLIEDAVMMQPVKNQKEVLQAEKKSVKNPEATQVIAFEKEAGAFLEIEENRYELKFDLITIGRHLSNDIRIDSPKVSSHHAKIVQENERFYLQDLKSTNKTYLNGKQVIRKMRLREGMSIQFADVSAVFHQPVDK